MADATVEVLTRRVGAVGHILLNRPQALNALTHGMVTTISATLAEWAADEAVESVLIYGAGDRGLCAGGDIVGIYRDALAGTDGTARFWADEYALNAAIAHYPKPYIAIMDGVVLGGGVGISAHGSVRVVTERTKLGMPEVGIGFTPDVGGSWLLSHAPGELGTHLALTGGTATGADAIALGLADHFVPSERLPELLESPQIERFAIAPPDSLLLQSRGWIDDCYASNDAEEIVARLQAAGVSAAADAASTILTKSPTSVKVTLEALRRARTLGSLEEALDQEYRVSLRFLAGTDLVEGIRAQVIDKDRTPRWSPATLAEVDRATVESYFAGLGAKELGLGGTVEP